MWNSRFDWSTDRLVLTHIPKTAGTALQHSLVQVFGDTFWQCTSADKEATPPAWARAAGGHFRHGLHPMHRLEPFYISIVRHPIDRYLSFYRHVLDHPEHHVHGQIPDAAMMSPLELGRKLLEIGSRELCNVQARYLTGHDEGEPATDLYLARKNIRIIGSQSKLSQFCKELGDFLGRDVNPPPGINLSSPRSITWETGLADFIERTNARDLAIYRALEA